MSLAVTAIVVGTVGAATLAGTSVYSAVKGVPSYTPQTIVPGQQLTSDETQLQTWEKNLATEQAKPKPNQNTITTLQQQIANGKLALGAEVASTAQAGGTTTGDLNDFLGKLGVQTPSQIAQAAQMVAASANTGTPQTPAGGYGVQSGSTLETILKWAAILGIGFFAVKFLFKKLF